jgi:hypothetical protein
MQMPDFVPFRRDDFREVDDETARDESEQRAVRGGGPLLDADGDEVVIGTPEMRPQSSAGAGYRLRSSRSSWSLTRSCVRSGKWWSERR